MSVEGPLGAYVNPGGHVHEMLTVAQTRGLRLIGRPTVENSWFDGSEQSLFILVCLLQTICWLLFTWRTSLDKQPQIKAQRDPKISTKGKLYIR